MTAHSRKDTTPRPAAMTPALRRSVLGRPLSWRNPWTLLLGVLAAFQAGVIVTLLSTSSRTTLSALEFAPRTASAPLATGPVAEPAGAAPAVTPPSVTPPSVTPPSVTPPSVTPPSVTPPPAPPKEPGHGRSSGRKPTVPAPPPSVAADAGTDAPDALIEVEITSEPEGATVRIAGAMWGVTPLTAYLPARAPVTIVIELDGHRPVRQQWSPTGRRALHAVLQPQESL